MLAADLFACILWSVRCFDMTEPILSSSLCSICPRCILAEKHLQVVLRFALVSSDYFSHPGSSCCINLLKTFFVWFMFLGCRTWGMWRANHPWSSVLKEKYVQIFSILGWWKFGRLPHYIISRLSLMDVVGIDLFPAWMAGWGCWGLSAYPRFLSQPF